MGREQKERHYNKRKKATKQPMNASLQKKSQKKRNHYDTSYEPVVGEKKEEAIEDNFVFGHHAAVEALQQGRGNKLFLQEDIVT